MAFEVMIGMDVADHEAYARYRTAIRPLLEAAGGRFRYDFEVARTLKSEASHDINRFFVLSFPDRERKEGFFSNPEFVRIRNGFFETAVRGTTILAEYTR